MLEINSGGIIISIIIVCLLIIKYFFNFKPKFVLPKKYFIQSKKNFLNITLGIIIFCAIILPLNIQFLKGKNIIEEKIIPVQIIFDVSLSMAADDIKPSRFNAAKSALNDMISTLDGYHISLITFSKIPFIRIPFSTDTNAISTKRKQTKLADFPPVQEFIGTAIGDALLLGIKNLEQFNNEQMQNGIIILITDGDSHEGTNINTVIPLLQKKQIPVYVFGIGEQDFLIGIDQQENTIKANVDIQLLQKIAKETGGEFSRVLTAKSFTNTMENIVKNVKTQEKETVIEEYFSINSILLILLGLNLFSLLYIQSTGLIKQKK